MHYVLKEYWNKINNNNQEKNLQSNYLQQNFISDVNTTPVLIKKYLLIHLLLLSVKISSFQMLSEKNTFPSNPILPNIISLFDFLKSAYVFNILRSVMDRNLDQNNNIKSQYYLCVLVLIQFIHCRISSK